MNEPRPPASSPPVRSLPHLRSHARACAWQAGPRRDARAPRTEAIAPVRSVTPSSPIQIKPDQTKSYTDTPEDASGRRPRAHEHREPTSIASAPPHSRRAGRRLPRPSPSPTSAPELPRAPASLRRQARSASVARRCASQELLCNVHDVLSLLAVRHALATGGTALVQRVARDTCRRAGEDDRQRRLRARRTPACSTLAGRKSPKQRDIAPVCGAAPTGRPRPAAAIGPPLIPFGASLPPSCGRGGTHPW